MKFATVFVSLLLAAAESVVAEDSGRSDGKHIKAETKHDHGKNSTSTPAECHEITKLSALMDVANNQTKLDKVSHHNATRAAEIKASASSAAPRLQSLEAN